MTMGVTEISQGLAAGKFSSVEVTQDYLARIAQHNPALNCFISVTDELALEQARLADASRAAVPQNPANGKQLRTRTGDFTLAQPASAGKRKLV